MAVLPFAHRALIKPDSVEKVTEGGIILALNEKREQAAVESGVIIALGETFGKDFGLSDLPKVGEKVYFAKYAGKFIKENGEDLVLLNDEDIVGIVR